VTFIGLLAGILGIGILRHQGEYHTRKMYDEKNKANYNGVIAESRAARSFAYSLDPTSVPLAWYAGNAFAALQNYTASHEQFLAAYRLNPYNRNVLNDLGSSFVIKNETESAKQLYEEAARISPRFDDAKLNLVAVYIQEKNYVKANEYLHSLLHDSERRSNYQKLVDAFLPQQH
jgi:tetratricopeptide (TPR) repeat protein